MAHPRGKPLQVGGAVDPRKYAYVVRPTDAQLLAALERGEYCNVLSSRQMGKTSLLTSTQQKLRDKGVRVERIDLAGTLGSPPSAEDWYRGLLKELAKRLKLKLDVDAWWSARATSTLNQRLLEFFREQVAQSDALTVIVLDEIDTTLKLPYTDDFFTAIRSMYNDRDQEPAYEQLAFCLVGVATPNELIKDRRTTPYNIGRTFELSDFDSKDDLSPLYDAVAEERETGRRLVDAVLEQTGGQPYLTAKLCEELSQRGASSPEDVAALVEELYPNLHWAKEDPHFGYILSFLSERVENQAEALELYGSIREAGSQPDQMTPTHVRLKLVGLVKRDGRGQLVVRNRIYQRIFTAEWAKEAMPSEKTVAQLLVRTLEQAVDDYALAREAYERLKAIPFYTFEAEELWARFFERRALRAEEAEKRDEALLWRLQAQRARPSELRARAVAQLTGEDFTKLEATFSLGSPDILRRELSIFDAPTLVAYSPDGRRVLTGSSDGTARVWSAETGEPVGAPLMHAGRVLSVAFSPDGRRVLTGSSYGTAWVWSAETGEPVGAPLRHAGRVLSVAFSPDGRRVLTGSRNGPARVWSAETGAPVVAPVKHARAVLSAAFSPDGRRVLTGSRNGTARVWSAKTGEPVGAPLQHAKAVLSVAYSPDGRRVLTGSFDGTARVWSAETGAPVGAPLQHAEWVRSVAFSPDGRRVLTGSSDGTARVWSAETGEPMGVPLKHASAVRSVAFSPDGRRGLTGSLDGTARVWSAETGAPVGAPLKHASTVLSVAYSSDGRRVLTGSLDGTARVWSAETGEPVGAPLMHADWVRSVAFSPDGRRVLTGSRDRTARVWSAETGEPVGAPLKHASAVRSVAFSPDERVLTGSEDGTARVWSAETGEPVGALLQHASAVLSVAFSPNGRRVLTGSEDGTTRVWSAETGEPVGAPLQHADWVRSVAFSPDGRRVLTGSNDRTARVWSAETGEPVGAPLKHVSAVLSVAFSPDGRRVLTGSVDGTARVWSAETGEPVGAPLKHSKAVLSVTFSPDGQFVFTQSGFWIHVARHTAEGLTGVSSSLSPVPLPQQTGFRFVDPSGARAQLVTGVADDKLVFWTVSPDLPEVKPFQGDAKQALEEYQRKLNLRIDEHGKLVPFYT